jgi:hypothetical protein
MASKESEPATFGQVVGLVNKLQQICTQLGDTAGNSILVDKLSSIVVVGGQVRHVIGGFKIIRERGPGRAQGHQPWAELHSKSCVQRPRAVLIARTMALVLHLTACMIREGPCCLGLPGVGRGNTSCSCKRPCWAVGPMPRGRTCCTQLI